jgi:hypothetical protein
MTTDLSTILTRLKSLQVIDEQGNNIAINSTGSAIVTLLRLIPYL